MKLRLPWKKDRRNCPLVRVDDRLLHGQVVVGWVQGASLRHLILASDRVRGDAALTSAIETMVPEDIEVTILSLDETVERWTGEDFGDGPSMIVVESPGEALRMRKLGAPLTELILGGMHFREGTTEFLPYIFLSRWDGLALEELQRSGVRITCQDLPATTPVIYQGQADS